MEKKNWRVLPAVCQLGEIAVLAGALCTRYTALHTPARLHNIVVQQRHKTAFIAYALHACAL